jgi:hypothetical protein
LLLDLILLILLIVSSASGTAITILGFVETVSEDPVNPKLLYAGTHFGLFASFDQGTHWVRVGDIPPLRVDDLQIHPRTSDLVIATHGRSIYVLDDSRPFRELTPEIANKPAHLFSVRPANGAYSPSGFSEWNGKGFIAGPIRPKARFLPCG